MLLRKEGNKKADKVEFFEAEEFPDHIKRRGIKVGQEYRLRVNGKWFDWKEQKFFFFSSLRNVVWKAIAKKLK